MPIHKSRVLYQDDSLLAVSKLSGELTVKAPGRTDTLPLYDFLKQDFPDIHPVNRLDFETSGIVLFARGRKTLQTMLEQDSSKWKKTYAAIVAGTIERPGGVINFPLPARSSKDKVEAKTLYRVVERYPVATYVEAEIETGRHHQIRKHFAMINHALLFDDIYGDKKFSQKMARVLKFRKFFLHASKLTIKHPITGETLTFEAPLPQPFEQCLERLRGM